MSVEHDAFVAEHAANLGMTVEAYLAFEDQARDTFDAERTRLAAQKEEAASWNSRHGRWRGRDTDRSTI